MAFGQELKDFVASYQAGYGLVRSKEEKEAAALDAEAKRAGIDKDKAQSGYYTAQAANVGNTAPPTDLERAQAEYYRAGAAERLRGPATTPVDDARAELLTQQAIDLQQSRSGNAALVGGIAPRVVSTTAEAIPVDTTPAAPAAPAAPAGTTPGAIPFAGELTSSPAIEAANAMATGGQIPTAPKAASAEAVKAAVTGGMSEAAPSAIPGAAPAAAAATGQPMTAAERVRGAGAAPAPLMAQVYQAIDPNNEMTESARIYLGMGEVYNHYIQQGMPEKAEAAAVAMLQYHRLASTRFAAIAKAAAESGDNQTAALALVKAYANIPTGDDVSLKMEGEDFVFEFTRDGQLMQQKILTPDELGAAALQISPTHFDEYIARAAGATPKAEDPYTPAERATLEESITTGFEEFTQVASDPETGHPSTAALLQDRKLAGPIKSAAGAIYRANNSMSPYDSVASAASVLFVDPDAPMEQPFTAKDGKGGMTSVTFPGRGSFKLPTEMFRQLDSLRAARANARNEELIEAATRSERDTETGGAFLDSAGALLGQMRDNLMAGPGNGTNVFTSPAAAAPPAQAIPMAPMLDAPPRPYTGGGF